MKPFIEITVESGCNFWYIHAKDHQGRELQKSVDPDFWFMSWRMARAKRVLKKQMRLLWTQEERDEYKQILRDERYESKHGPFKEETPVQCDPDMSQVPEGTSHTEHSIRPRGPRKGDRLGRTTTS